MNKASKAGSDSMTPAEVVRKVLQHLRDARFDDEAALNRAAQAAGFGAVLDGGIVRVQTADDLRAASQARGRAS